ncbi:hypothetical protein HK104_010244 [Borealophlyctis nickersoniae]|nr:hypothetical protein HK104_010244 [Borealophlyctis nickersoniae]
MVKPVEEPVVVATADVDMDMMDMEDGVGGGVVPVGEIKTCGGEEMEQWVPSGKDASVDTSPVAVASEVEQPCESEDRKG